MIEPLVEELVHREVDRETTPEESRALEELAARRDDVQAYLERVRGLSRTLHGLEDAEPPAGLLEDVMRRVRRKPPHVPAVGFLEALRSALRPPALRYAGAFASGIALGALVVALAGPSPLSRLDGPSFSGTMLPGNRRAGFESADRERVEAAGVRVDAATRAAGDLVTLELRLETDRVVDVAVEFEGGVFSTVAFERTGPAGADVRLGPDHVRLRHAGGGDYLLTLRAFDESPSGLRVTIGGVTEITLDTRPGP